MVTQRTARGRLRPVISRRPLPPPRPGVEIAWLNGDGRAQGPGIFVPSTITYDGKAADPELPH
jgi:hypothetical protein